MTTTIHAYAFKQVEPGSCKAGFGGDPPMNTSKMVKQMTVDILATFKNCHSQFRYLPSFNPRRVLTKPSEGVSNRGYDNLNSDYILYVNDTLVSKKHNYTVLDLLGQGTFGQVVKCKQQGSDTLVAVKVIKNKPAYTNQGVVEIRILEMLNEQYDKEDKHHLVRLVECFSFRSHLCLVFELLSINLYELLKQNQFRGLSTHLIRVFTIQILDALSVLAEANIIHCDLKPENILLQNLTSPNIKLIDFGSACFEAHTVYSYIQSRFYRSPEVLVGYKPRYDSGIDMWSLGCICCELFLGLPLFPGSSEFNQVYRITEMQGPFPDYVLEGGKFSLKFYKKVNDGENGQKFVLKTEEEYAAENNTPVQPSKKYFNYSTLKELIENYPVKKALKPAEVQKEKENRKSFLDFLLGLLQPDPAKRWSAAQAKQHPFITGEPFTSPFVPAAPLKRKVPPITGLVPYPYPMPDGGPIDYQNLSPRGVPYMMPPPQPQHQQHQPHQPQLPLGTSPSVQYGFRSPGYQPTFQRYPPNQPNRPMQPPMNASPQMPPPHPKVPHIKFNNMNYVNPQTPTTPEDHEAVMSRKRSHSFGSHTSFEARAGNPQQKPYKQPNPQQPAKKSPRGPRPRAPSYADQRGGNPSPQSNPVGAKKSPRGPYNGNPNNSSSPSNYDPHSNRLKSQSHDHLSPRGRVPSGPQQQQQQQQQQAAVINTPASATIPSPAANNNTNGNGQLPAGTSPITPPGTSAAAPVVPPSSAVTSPVMSTSSLSSSSLGPNFPPLKIGQLPKIPEDTSSVASPRRRVDSDLDDVLSEQLLYEQPTEYSKTSSSPSLSAPSQMSPPTHIKSPVKSPRYYNPPWKNQEQQQHNNNGGSNAYNAMVGSMGNMHLGPEPGSYGGGGGEVGSWAQGPMMMPHMSPSSSYGSSYGSSYTGDLQNPVFGFSPSTSHHMNMMGSHHAPPYGNMYPQYGTPQHNFYPNQNLYPPNNPMYPATSSSVSHPYMIPGKSPREYTEYAGSDPAPKLYATNKQK